MPGERTTWRAEAPGPPDEPKSGVGQDTQPFDPLDESELEATEVQVARQEPASPPAQSSALVLDRYRLVRTLGAGGFGTVWLAHDERLGRSVAVKAIPGGGGVRARAEREALAAARLNHPGIVMLFEAGDEGGVTYLVSELVDGYTLAELYADGVLSDRDVLRVGLALCDALAHAHAHGVVHRDVKPANVLVPSRRAQGAAIVKLADFGVAQVAGGGDLLTGTGDVVGTLAYMAPEQAEGRSVGSPCDLYALALVLYEGLAGENPVRASTPAATARRLGRPLPPLARRRRGLPSGLDQAIDVALSVDPTARGTIGELRAALNEALPLVDIEPGPVGRSRFEFLSLAALPVGRVGRVSAGLVAAVLAGLALTRLGPAPALAAPLALGAGALVALLPRIGWLLGAMALIAWQFAPAQHAGVAVVLLAAVLAPPLLLPRRGELWSLPAGAPLLGLIGLAGAWPALAGQARGPWRRAALGAIGFWWLCLAELLVGHGLYLARPQGVIPRSEWESTIAPTVEHALQPLVSAGRPLGAVVWALAAVVLPWLVRGPRVVALAGAMLWAGTLGAAMGFLPGAPSGATVALGAAAGGALALARAWVRRAESPDVRPPVP